MATAINPHSSIYTIDEKNSEVHSKPIIWTVPVARFLFSLIFVVSGINHFSSGSISYAASTGLPMADILVPISGIIALIGGLSLLTGFHARVGSVLILMFLIPVTLIMHNFWSITAQEMVQMQLSHFMKNVALIGGALLFSFYGAGPVSLDHRRARHSAR